jgi:hypothetical protein
LKEPDEELLSTVKQPNYRDRLEQIQNAK